MKTFQEAILYIKKDNKILLGKKKHGLHLGIINGVGGSVRNGETFDETAVREAQEKIGVTPAKLEKVAVKHSRTYLKGKWADLDGQTFIAADCIGEPIEAGKTRPVWYALDKIPYEQMPADDRMLLARVLNGEKVKGFFDFDKDGNMVSHSVAAVQDINDEVFDVLDENEGWTGDIISRDEAHKVGAYHRAVALYIVNNKKQVLMQKRSEHKKTWPGCWDFALGGHVEAGELGLMSVIREADEELGITIKPNEIRYISGYRSEQKDEKMWDRHFNEYYIAFKGIDISSVKLQKNEVDEIKWLDYDKFKEMVIRKDSSLTSKWNAHKAFIKYFDKYETERNRGV